MNLKRDHNKLTCNGRENNCTVVCRFIKNGKISFYTLSFEILNFYISLHGGNVCTLDFGETKSET